MTGRGEAAPPEGGRVGGWTWPESAVTVLGAHVALLVGGSIVLAIGGWDTPFPIEAQFLALLPFWAVAVVGPWRVASRTGGAADALALRVRPVDVPMGIVVGVAVQLVVIPLVYWPLLHLVDRDAADLERAAEELADTATGAVGTTVFVVMTCLVAPFVEELLYRGFLQRSGDGRRPVVAIAVAAVVFAMLHLQGLQFVGLALFGAAAGVLVWRTGRLGPAIIAHVAFNATTVIGLLAGR